MKQQHVKNWYIAQYRKLSAADYYIIGFTFGTNVFITTLEKLPPRFIKLYGDHLRIKKFSYKDKGYLMQHGGTYLCDIVDLEAINHNKGIALEKYIKGLYGIDNAKHDTTPFFIKGDICIDGKQVQIKFDHGHMVKHNTLVKQLMK